MFMDMIFDFTMHLVVSLCICLFFEAFTLGCFIMAFYSFITFGFKFLDRVICIVALLLCLGPIILFIYFIYVYFVFDVSFFLVFHYLYIGAL